MHTDTDTTSIRCLLLVMTQRGQLWILANSGNCKAHKAPYGLLSRECRKEEEELSQVCKVRKGVDLSSGRNGAKVATHNSFFFFRNRVFCYLARGDIWPHDMIKLRAGANCEVRTGSEWRARSTEIGRRQKQMRKSRENVILDKKRGLSQRTSGRLSSVSTMANQQ